MVSSKVIKLLLISQDTLSSVMQLKQLNSCHFDVITALYSDSIVNLTEAHNPDLILLYTKIHIFESEGLILLKELSSNNTTPIFVLSDSPDIETKLLALNSGAVDYLTLPFDFRELVSRIKIHVRVHQSILELKKENAVLEYFSITDPATGLYNKRYILNRLHSEISQSVQYSEPISFIMLDVDYFKKTNDKYGHLAGDELLKDLAVIIKNCIRSVDFAARYGGEEFLIVCPNTDSQGAKILAERIRISVQNAKFDIKGHSIKISLSVGIRTKQFDTDTNAEDIILKLIDEADAALYKAKFKGRNRVEVFTCTDHIKQLSIPINPDIFLV